MQLGLKEYLTTLGEVDGETDRLIDKMAEFMPEKDKSQFLAYQYLFPRAMSQVSVTDFVPLPARA